MKRNVLPGMIFLSLLAVTNCTDLEEKYGGHLTDSQVVESDNIDALLVDLTNALQSSFQNSFGDVISLSEITTDELIAPTRGPDWDDNGIWRQLHQHRWTGDHIFVTGCFNDLNGVIFAATNILKFNPTPQQEAIVRFYRAWAMYWVLDFFDQVPYRDPGESTLLPARVRKGLDALDYIITEINDVMQNLPDGPATKPNKNAARVLLMKCYLNKGVYLNRPSAPTFDIGDMNRVIELADEVIVTNQYSFSANYFDNFAPNNASVGLENIFTEENVGGVPGSSALPLYTIIPRHYTMIGFNGWATLSDFYDKFEEGDNRRGQAYPTGEGSNPGNRINIGFLIGQQYDLNTDEPLITESGIPVAFTRDVNSIETDADLQMTGIRPQKYALDIPNIFSSAPGNDWVYFRLPDVLLMKAEATMRGGTATSAGPYGSTALELVNSIRVHPSRGASILLSVDLNVLLDERGRELWLECWRRQDLIRFGKFLEPFQEKYYVSDAKYLLFPIPNQQLAVKNNLDQNPGY